MSYAKFTTAIFTFALAFSVCQTGFANDIWSKAANHVKKRVGTGVKAAKTEAGRAASSFKRAHQLNYNVTLQNRSKYTIPYVFNGQTQIALLPNQQLRLWGTKAGAPSISFRNQYGQIINYSLQQQGTFYFSDGNGALNLYRR